MDRVTRQSQIRVCFGAPHLAKTVLETIYVRINLSFY